MIEIPEKFDKYFPSSSVKLGAVVGIVLSQVDDPQTSQTDWIAGAQLNNPIATTLDGALSSGGTTIKAASTNDFTAASASNPAYIIITDGANREIVKYGDCDANNFKSVTRAQYGTTARSWNSGVSVYQLLFSHGVSPSYDLGPQPRNWFTHAATGGPPSDRVGHGWIYRPTDGCFYMTCGYASDGNYKNDLWKYNPSSHTWTQIVADGATGNPARRAYMACVYSPSYDQIWIFGGRDATTQYRNVYKYSFGSSAWTTNSNWDASGVRYKMQSCWYPVENKMIVSGGQLQNGSFEDYQTNCWIFSGSTWTTKKSMPVSLAKGDGCWMISERRFFVVGRSSGGDYKSMAYNPVANTWESGSIANPPTSKRDHPACCYDPISKKALVFGGEVSGTAQNDLWSFDYSANAWQQLASYAYDAGNDSYSRHGIEWDATYKHAVAWGGWNDGTPTWHAHDAPIFFRHYHADVDFRTQAIDIGAAPDGDGDWNIEDVYDFMNASNGVSYTAEYSDNGTSWTSMGAVSDGEGIASRHRYYRVAASFSCDGIIAPSVQKINTVFDNMIEMAFADRPLGDRYPLVKSVGNISNAIDPVKCTAQIGSVTFEILDTEKIASRLFAACFLTGKTITLKIGPIAPDVEVSEFVKAFTGIIESWEYDGDVILIRARDFLGKLEKDVPEENSNGSVTALIYSTTGIASNPVEILLDILRNRLNVPDRYLDLASFDEVKSDSTLTGWNFIRTISDPTDAYELCLEICRLIGAILIPREDGRIALKKLSNTASPVAAWNAMRENFQRPNFDSNANSSRNFISTWWHWLGTGEEWNDFEGAQIAVDADSVANWGTNILRTKAKWLGDNVSPYNGSQLALAISQRVLGFAKEGLPIVSFEADISTLGVQVGDVARIQSTAIANQEIYLDWQFKYNPNRDLIFTPKSGRSSVPYLEPECAECVDMLWWVTRKRIDLNRGTIKWELTRCRKMPLEKDYTSQADFYKGSGENIDLESSSGTIKLAQSSPGVYYTTGSYELVIDLGQQPERAGAWSLETNAPWANPMMITYKGWASETGKFLGEEMPLGDVHNWDAITVKTRYYKIIATLHANSNNTATPLLYRIKASFPV